MKAEEIKWVFLQLVHLIATAPKFSPPSMDDPVNYFHDDQSKRNWQWEPIIVAKPPVYNNVFSMLTAKWLKRATYEPNGNREWNYKPLAPR